jgi:ectoine hydroxylase-related dioxygenase (phytanoyl-CoA dioxygenase family)
VADQDGEDIHRDGGQLFPELAILLPASGVCVDIPLVDFTEENGSIRVFPGTHLVVDDPPSDVRNIAERAKGFSATQLATPAGSIILRDMRLWHSPMPNRTDQDRPWMNLLYVRVFQHAHERMYIPLEIKQSLPKHARRLLRTAISPVVEPEPLAT